MPKTRKGGRRYSPVRQHVYGGKIKTHSPTSLKRTKRRRTKRRRIRKLRKRRRRQSKRTQRRKYR